MMSHASAAAMAQTKPTANGRLNGRLDAVAEGGLRFSAFVVEQTPFARRQFTDGAERIGKRARDLAALFNRSQVSEAMIVLAILLDAEGPKELGKYGIVAQETYAACLRTLGALEPAREPTVGEAALERVLALAKGRAGRREKGIDLVAVEDLVQAILQLPRTAATPRNDPVQAMKQVAASKSLRKGGLRAVAGWLSLAVAIGAATTFVGIAGFLLWKGAFEWTSLMRGFV
jgi:hypothetical protein